MNKRTEAVISLLAAFFVLLSAMFDARVSSGLAIIFLVALATYTFIQKDKSSPRQ